MPAPSPAPVCNFWPPAAQCFAASRNFASLLEALFCLLLASALILPFFHPWPPHWQGAGQPPLVTCGRNQGLRNFASASTTITICSTATTYTSNHAHNCINIFLQVEEIIRKCEILAFVVYERSRGSFWLATASALLLLARTPNHQIPTPLSQQLSSTIWVKRGLSWKKVGIFLLISHFSCWLQFGDLRGDENAHHKTFVKIGLNKVKDLGKLSYWGSKVSLYIYIRLVIFQQG